MHIRFLLFTALVLLGLACTAPKEKIPDTYPMNDSTRKIVVYQMLTRLFGNTNTTNKPWGTLEENGVGKFNDISGKALQGIKELGVTHVWYTGVLEHALLTDYTKFGIPLDDADVVKGRAGSPYSIKDYYDVNPDLAVDVPKRLQEFDSLIARTHAHGMKVIIDFVPNHVARKYKSDQKPAGVKDFGEDDDVTVSFKASNNFYYLPGQSFQPPQDYNSLGPNPFPNKDKKFEETPAKVTGNNQFTATPGVNEWFEAVKLNYGVDIQNGNKTYFNPVPDTWVKMKDILVYWTNKNVDGFRCDMAEMVPVEFWQWAIPQVKAVNPEILFIAEIYNPGEYRNYLQKGKFDFLYDKVQLYDTLRLLVNRKSHTGTIHDIQKSLEGINHNMLHFLENHDEQRIASPFFVGDMWKAVPAMVVSATIDQAPIMIYFGQEVGEPGAGVQGFSGEDGRTSHFDYSGVPEHQKWMNSGKFDGALLSDEQKALRQFYADILTLASNNPAITQGSYYDVTWNNQAKGNIDGSIHAFVRHSGEEKLLIVSSFSDKTVAAKIQLTEEVIKALGLKSPTDVIGRDLLRSGAEVGFNEQYELQLDIPAFSSFIFKLK